MILPDLNLLIHAYNRDSLVHTEARRWWESRMNDPAPVGMAWVAMLGFIRISDFSRFTGVRWTNPLAG